MKGEDNRMSLPSSSNSTTTSTATSTTSTTATSTTSKASLLSAAPTTIVTMVQTDEASVATVLPTSERSIRFRMPTGDIIHHRVNLASTTIRQLKELLATDTIPASRMRLIRGGQVLQDETDTLEKYQFTDKDTIYVVRGAQNETPAITPEALSRVDSQSDQSSPFGMSNDPMGGLMESPLMKNLMSDSNFMREMIVNHPDMKRLAEENLEVAHMLQHPELFETIVAAQKPQIMREMLRNNDRALSNIEAMPGGFNHLRQMYEGVQEPLMEAERPKNESTDAMNRAFAMRFNIRPNTTQESDEPNANALPNPWRPPHHSTLQPRSIAARDLMPLPFESNFRPRLTTQPMELPRAPRSIFRTQHPFASLRSPQRLGSSTSNTATTTTNNNNNNTNDNNNPPPSFLQAILASHRNVPNLRATSTNETSIPATTSTATNTVIQPSTRYPEQLEKMRSMGFTDDEKNTRALSLTGGDLNGAVEWLVNYGNGSSNSSNNNNSSSSGNANTSRGE
ncbi:hypothetical protein BDF22DRAFT_744800 [Syncephalis plumigaleata]|nr:hypothetical protein BDF22DRAFT_744800 [Syncephalis plumigaleata]